MLILIIHTSTISIINVININNMIIVIIVVICIIITMNLISHSCLRGRPPKSSIGLVRKVHTSIRCEIIFSRRGAVADHGLAPCRRHVVEVPLAVVPTDAGVYTLYVALHLRAPGAFPDHDRKNGPSGGMVLQEEWFFGPRPDHDRRNGSSGVFSDHAGGGIHRNNGPDASPAARDQCLPDPMLAPSPLNQNGRTYHTTLY